MTDNIQKEAQQNKQLSILQLYALHNFVRVIDTDRTLIDS